MTVGICCNPNSIIKQVPNPIPTRPDWSDKFICSYEDWTGYPTPNPTTDQNHTTDCIKCVQTGEDAYGPKDYQCPDGVHSKRHCCDENMIIIPVYQLPEERMNQYWTNKYECRLVRECPTSFEITSQVSLFTNNEFNEILGISISSDSQYVLYVDDSPSTKVGVSNRYTGEFIKSFTMHSDTIASGANWESLTRFGNYYYIGDTGTNTYSRATTNLILFREPTEMSDLSMNLNVTVIPIEFAGEGSDIEAMYVYGSSIYMVERVKDNRANAQSRMYEYSMLDNITRIIDTFRSIVPGLRYTRGASVDNLVSIGDRNKLYFYTMDSEDQFIKCSVTLSLNDGSKQEAISFYETSIIQVPECPSETPCLPTMTEYRFSQSSCQRAECTPVDGDVWDPKYNCGTGKRVECCDGMVEMSLLRDPLDPYFMKWPIRYICNLPKLTQR